MAPGPGRPVLSAADLPLTAARRYALSQVMSPRRARLVPGDIIRADPTDLGFECRSRLTPSPPAPQKSAPKNIEPLHTPRVSCAPLHFFSTSGADMPDAFATLLVLCLISLLLAWRCYVERRRKDQWYAHWMSTSHALAIADTRNARYEHDNHLLTQELARWKARCYELQAQEDLPHGPVGNAGDAVLRMPQASATGLVPTSGDEFARAAAARQSVPGVSAAARLGPSGTPATTDQERPWVTQQLGTIAEIRARTAGLPPDVAAAERAEFTGYCGPDCPGPAAPVVHPPGRAVPPVPTAAAAAPGPTPYALWDDDLPF